MSGGKWHEWKREGLANGCLVRRVQCVRCLDETGGGGMGEG